MTNIWKKGRLQDESDCAKEKVEEGLRKEEKHAENVTQMKLILSNSWAKYEHVDSHKWHWDVT